MFLRVPSLNTLDPVVMLYEKTKDVQDTSGRILTAWKFQS